MPGCPWGGSGCGVAWNTLWLALLCAVGTTFLGLMLALIVTRSNFSRAKKALRLLTVLPIITPPFVVGLALIMCCSVALAWSISSSNGVQHSANALGLWPARCCWHKVVCLHPRGVSGADRRGQGRQPPRWRGESIAARQPLANLPQSPLPLMAPGWPTPFWSALLSRSPTSATPWCWAATSGVMATEIYFAIVGAQLDPGQSRGCIR